MSCRNGACHKPGREYRYALGRRTTVLCDDCHAALTAIGMALTATTPDPRPEWLRRGVRGRDETGRVVAA